MYINFSSPNDKLLPIDTAPVNVDTPSVETPVTFRSVVVVIPLTSAPAEVVRNFSFPAKNNSTPLSSFAAIKSIVAPKSTTLNLSVCNSNICPYPATILFVFESPA